MYVVIVFSLVCLFLTYLDSIGLFKKGLTVSFIILAILAAIHYDYGNDYMGYYDLYNSLTCFPFDYKSIINGDYKDFGWVILCYLFKPLGGFFTMVAVLSIIQNLFVFRFIKSEVDKSWWPMAIFIYLFNTTFYLLNFSMLRQGFVVCVFLGLWPYIRDRKWWIPFIVLSLCSTIHGSSIVLLPFSFMGFFPAKLKRFIAGIYLILLLLLFISNDFINETFERFLRVETFSEYADIYGDSQAIVTFGLGFIMNLIPFIIAEYYFLKTKDNVYNIQLVMLSMLYFIIIPFVVIVPLISRVAIYFGIYQIAAIPIVFKSIKNKQVRSIVMLPWLFINIYSYWAFFNHGVYAEPYRSFHTIFEVIQMCV